MMPGEEQLNDFLLDLHGVYGYDFTGYATSSLRRRIGHFMLTHKIASFEELEQRLLSREEDFERFVQEIAVNVTEMFRDPPFFKCIREVILKRLATYPHLRIWIAGCSTGEEAYSMAILLHEENLLDRSRIYATDISQRVLQQAKDGIFPLERMKLYTGNYLKSGGKNSFSQYYHAHYHAVKFDSRLRKNMVFAAHNLATDSSFNEFHLVLCRNVLIYFDQQLQDRVIGLLHDSLCPFGFLGLGSRESLTFRSHQENFTAVDRKLNLYMKNEGDGKVAQ